MKYLLFILGSLALLSCADQTPTPELQETPVATISTEKYDIALFSPYGELTDGFNNLRFAVMDKQGKGIDLPRFAVHTVMHMQHMKHGGPVSAFRKLKTGSYEGFAIFQMPSNSLERWEIILNQTDTLAIDILPSKKVRTQSFVGSDGLRYVLALEGPKTPKIGSNPISAYLYRMQDAFTFLPVEGYSLALDPRMPGMGNHSSPNNRDFVSKGNGLYEGTVNLTMTGYWKLNLVLSKDKVIKGEKEDSTLYFELEF